MNADEAARTGAAEQLAVTRLAAFDDALRAGAAPPAAGPPPENARTLTEAEWERARAAQGTPEAGRTRTSGHATLFDPLPPDTVVGHYRILERRGGGGM